MGKAVVRESSKVCPSQAENKCHVVLIVAPPTTQSDIQTSKMVSLRDTVLTLEYLDTSSSLKENSFTGITTPR